MTNIATHTGSYIGLESGAHVASDGWHAIGSQLPEGASATETLEAAGINWTVSKQPIRAAIHYGKEDSGVWVDVPGKFALVRDTDNKVFDVVGKDWRPYQNADAAAVFDAFIKTGQVSAYAAGATQQGQNPFFVAKINKSFTFLGEDLNEGFLLFTNPHKHGLVYGVSAFSRRFWCANQVPYGIGRHAKDCVRFHHNARDSFRSNPALAHKVIAESVEGFERLEGQARILAGGKPTASQLAAYFRQVWNIEHAPEGTPAALAKEINERHDRIFEKILVAHNDQPGIEYGRGTWWHASNTASYIVDHVAGRGDEGKRFHTAQFGAGRERKKKAFALALEYARA